MKKIISIIALALVCATAFAWGPRGHGTAAALAELNMKPSTVKQIEGYLGRSMPFYGVWPDEWREDPAYKWSSSCHSFPVDGDYKYAPVEGKMDAITLLDQAISVVKDRKHQSDSAVAVNLKFIIHLVGDIHCPVHVKYTTIKTNFKVIPYRGEEKKVSYHNVWDEQIIDRRCEYLSPRELAADFNRLSKKEIKAIQEGTIRDWANENAAESYVIYDGVQAGDLMTKAFYNASWERVQTQITRAGYRLAKVLEDCFAK